MMVKIFSHGILCPEPLVLCTFLLENEENMQAVVSGGVIRLWEPQCIKTERTSLNVSAHSIQETASLGGG